ncbi:transposase [Kitasatospora sp. RG8]|uniref:transposase n=1 Tax=Kitasatospora sp. RG8 TaxID=2820815 RepID=UPI001FD8127D|nr:transposase [Kitasatospora sp. RG8]
MTDAQWAAVPPLLPVPAWFQGRGGRPEGYCHRQLLDTIRHRVAGGISCRAMPSDFPARARAYAFFHRRREHRLIAEFHDRLHGTVREREGREAEPNAHGAETRRLMSLSFRATPCLTSRNQRITFG